MGDGVACCAVGGGVVTSEGELRFVAEHALGAAGELEAENGSLRRRLFEQKQWHADQAERWAFEREGLVWDKDQAEARAAVAEEELRAALEELDGIKGRIEQ